MKTMKHKLVLIYVLAATLVYSCKPQYTDNMKMLETEQLIAWCVVAFDANERTPEDRALMLKDLGMKRLAYDYRDRHLPDFEKEISILADNDIELCAVWLWIQEEKDQLLDPNSEFVVSVLEENEVATTLWLSFPDNFFEGLNDDQKMSKAVAIIAELNERVERFGTSIALYNHGGWFGEPENLVKIVEALASDNISIVYNFHHGHHHIQHFNEHLKTMLPYLSTLNLNGMNIEGPKILDIGKGKEEQKMLKMVIDAGYDGNFGIIGHTEGENISIVLKRNLAGLESILQNL